MLPQRLKHDSIIEALCEIRFEPAILPEVALGRLIERSPIKSTPARLAAADVPAPIRSATPEFRFQPWYEFRSEAGRMLRVGPNLISYHRTAPYVGWPRFKPEIDEMVLMLFSAINGFKLLRIGLRYVNALVPEKHHLDGVQDLRVRIDVAGRAHTGPAYLNVVEEEPGGFVVNTRIASPIFVHGAPPGVSAVIDVDVGTSGDSANMFTQEQVSRWVEDAHTYEKQAFFRLFPPEILSTLVEE